ncbi:copper resistance protein CopC/CopD [Synechococcus sp. Nb3U1]|uniref:copper resistance CopC/CopD family protein n=1 Tax=Synechococcus sp. Nb3U1 TaxID=1914529 RepID=UPI001F3E28A8|nr:copper resistance protein CopC [Synechococcus sp. Nb3U1]MCF2969790.1 copper resistance protein CopC/CopD [Synechococcus sp. Nb3U1]
MQIVLFLRPTQSPQVKVKEEERANFSAYTYFLGGLRFGKELLQQLLREKVMRESVLTRLLPQGILSGILCFLLWLAGIQPGWAHASLLATFPADGAVLAEPPAQIELRFNEPVQITQLQVLSSTGQAVELGELAGSADAPQAPIGIRIPAGSYIVSWRAISADSHPVSGSFVFQVGEANPEALQVLLATHGSADPLRWPLLIVRWGIYVGSLFGVGVLGGWRLLRGRLSAEAASWAFAAAWITLSLTVVAFCLHLAQLYPHFTGGNFVAVLGSPYGWGIQLRLLGLGLLIWACEGGGAWVSGLVGSLLVIGSFLPIGHALTSEYPLWTMALLGLHLAGSAFWLGGLWGLDQLLKRDPTSESVAVVQRFSDVATWAVPGLILAGVGMGGIHRGWTMADSYGQYLWAKLILVLMIMALGAHNKFRLVPALREGSLAVRKALRSIVRLEWVGLLAVLALSSFLVAQAPPSHGLAHGEGSLASSVCQEQSDDPPIHLRLSPCRPGSNQVLVEVEGIPAQELTLAFSLPERGIPPFRRSILPDESGQWVLQEVQLALPGEWQIDLALLISDFEERRGQVRVSLSP